ncbi:unnamed protein product [Rotaria socialis]|uniref:N-acetyltransferase domain-containing protein n=1 Tax=Rotaria socialis TaxID=392032 RepID=A0A818D477_9BILA|nr:unnamed protein product [Rotaria socialis]CAF3404635.1 unnamed protein product [Rotaria socialis]CAF3435587.1 unnamed protein product [Rotaria socialis]CAF4287841.1 unnamed protein product [Rotaria socialis]CAF4434589.1 unnamed protein product [Rotaria socialis]
MIIQYFTLRSSHIRTLYIDPNDRGQGFGGILLQHMINCAREHDILRIKLKVNTSNIPAYRLYQQYDFQPVELLSQYYSKDADAYRILLLLL